MKDIKKTLDLDSFGQVSFKLPQQTRVGTSFARTSQQPIQETNKTVIGSSKGKKVAGTKQQAMIDQQGKNPLVQSQVVEIPKLQTPLNEEKCKKRDRGEATPISGPAKQLGAKRKRLSPLSEEEIIEQTTKSLRGERVTQQTSPVVDTSSSSQRQELERQHSLEVSSIGPPSKQTSNIKRTLTEIKARNDPLRLQIYNQYLKMAPTKQKILMSAYDIKEGKMIMSYFKPKVQQPQSTADYIRTNLEVLAKDIHQQTRLNYTTDWTDGLLHTS